MVIPALLQPAWGILRHLRDGLEVGIRNCPVMAFGGLMLFAAVHVVLGAIFVPYMGVSKRVKATFPGQAAP